MAKVAANRSFDQTRIDLYAMIKNPFVSVFRDNGEFVFEEKEYSDIVVFGTQSGTDYYLTGTLGNSITVNSKDEITGGSIRVIDHLFWDGGSYVPFFSVSWIDLAAKSFFAAASTRSTKDDAELMRQVLSGDDRFLLSRFDDVALRFAGNDRMFGKDGDDRLSGGSGNDRMFGGDGNDTLLGEEGKDEMRGSTGADVFVFKGIAESAVRATTADVILDFSIGLDRINLAKIDAFNRSDANDSFVWNGTAGFSNATGGEVRYQKFDKAGTSNDYTMVYLDNDRDRAAEMAIRLKGLHNLTAEDFVL